MRKSQAGDGDYFVAADLKQVSRKKNPPRDLKDSLLMGEMFEPTFCLMLKKNQMGRAVRRSEF